MPLKLKLYFTIKTIEHFLIFSVRFVCMGLIVLEIDTFHLDISDILKIQLANFHLLKKYGRLKKQT